MIGWILSLLPFTAGAASTLQAATNGALAARIGLPATLFVSTTVTAAVIVPLYLAKSAGTPLFPPGASWVLYLGGVYGFVILAVLAFAFPRLGGAWTIAVMVLGQGMAALAVDHFGAFGQLREPVSVTRLAGVVLVAVGTLMMRWK